MRRKSIILLSAAISSALLFGCISEEQMEKNFNDAYQDENTEEISQEEDEEEYVYDEYDEILAEQNKEKANKKKDKTNKKEKSSKTKKDKSDKKKQKDNEEEKVYHRAGTIGVSNKDIDSILHSMTYEVGNDVTGNLRYIYLFKKVNILKYTISIYENIFIDDKTVVGVIDDNLKTIYRLSDIGDRIRVTALKYDMGEEKNANIIFGGSVITEYDVFIDNGDIQKVQ